MSQAIEQFVNRVIIYANPTEAEEPSIRSELEDHLYTKVEELVKQGETREDAVFQAIEAQGRADEVGYGLRKFRWVDVRTKGTARGFIAIGPRAVGVFAFGGVAVGVFAFAGISIGLFGFGGIVLSLLFGWGGCVVSVGSAYGGLALGTIAIGGVAAGVYVAGGTAFGIYAAGASHATWSLHAFKEAPDWIRPLIQETLSGSTYVFLNALLVTAWLALFAFMLLMQRRERNRIYRADPRLVE